MWPQPALQHDFCDDGPDQNGHQQRNHYTARSFDLPAFVEYLLLSFYEVKSYSCSNFRLLAYPPCLCFCVCDDSPL
jgi:hypothetical protein